MTATTDSALDWLEYVKPFSAGLVVAPQALRELGLDQSLPQRATDSTVIAAHLADGPSLPDPWAFFVDVLGWDAAVVAGAPGGPPLPENLTVRLSEHQTTLAPTYAVRERQGDAVQLLVKVEAPGIDPDSSGVLTGWAATALAVEVLPAHEPPAASAGAGRCRLRALAHEPRREDRRGDALRPRWAPTPATGRGLQALGATVRGQGAGSIPRHRTSSSTASHTP